MNLIGYSDVPQMFHEPTAIFLSCEGRYWSQFIYQFSHELCHLMINDKFHSKLKWFEESICELASRFFLHELSKSWNICPPYSHWQEYSKSIYEYYQDINTTTLSCENSFSDFISENLSYLETHSYDRDRNGICALELLPFFQRSPGLWKDFIYPAHFKDIESFEIFLKQWHKISENKEEVEKIISVFGF